MTKDLLALTIVVLALTAGPAALAKEDKLPETTHDGLTLQKHTKLDAVYFADDVDLSQYTKVAILDCYVAFRKNWQEDYNRQERGVTRQISDDDMEKMRQEFADEFLKIFTKELQDKHGYEIVNVTGPDVLIVRPALINIDVTAPSASNRNTPGMARTYAANPGQMTLYMELYDSISNAILVRAVDTKGGRSQAGFMMTSSVSNRAAADRALRAWADLLAKQLGEIAPPPKGGKKE